MGYLNITSVLNFCLLISSDSRYLCESKLHLSYMHYFHVSISQSDLQEQSRRHSRHLASTNAAGTVDVAFSRKAFSPSLYEILLVRVVQCVGLLHVPPP